MPAPWQVGITGGIGSGKSTVAAIFHCLRIPIYDADSRAKMLMRQDAQLVKQIKNEFGERAYHGAQLDRAYLAENVFGFPDRLAKLNGFVHPRVAEDYRQWTTVHTDSVYLLKEAALLFETGSAKDLDKIIVVTAPEQVRLQRVQHRDGRSEQAVRDIMQRQLPEENRIAQADFVINNDGTTAVIPQVLRIHQNILSLLQHRG